jgi:hypothetical protein
VSAGSYRQRRRRTAHACAILESVNWCANHVGRLIEVRVESGYRSVEDVDTVFAEFARVVAKLPAGQRLVTVIDWRRCPVMSASASERMVPIMVRSNPRSERSAALASRDSPIAVMQLNRIIVESKHPDRRLFYEPETLIAYLGEVLTPAETARLRAFLKHEEP